MSLTLHGQSVPVVIPHLVLFQNLLQAVTVLDQDLFLIAEIIFNGVLHLRRPWRQKSEQLLRIDNHFLIVK